MLLIYLINILFYSFLQISTVSSIPLVNNNEEKSKIWALLVAGSNDWINYRHQADICHSYHVLRNHGISEENIITMMYDDIAYNEENKYPGLIRNEINGTNVYKGVKIDYRKDEVTPQNFINILLGHDVSGKKVIKSTAKDHIFVYFSDHGASGLLQFPNDILTAKTLIETLNKMHNRKLYDKMVIYTEACESGSMFTKLTKNLGIFATTASNVSESSYACYYDKDLDVYLGDEYSVNWMQDSDMHRSLRYETLQEQFKRVRNKTLHSSVCEFGELSISNLHVSDFQGYEISDEVKETNNANIEKPRDSVPSRDVPLIVAKKLLEKSNSNENEAYLFKYNNILNGRHYMDKMMKKIYAYMMDINNNNIDTLDYWFNYRYDLNNLDCHHNLVNTFHKTCYNLAVHEYALRYVYLITNICEHKITNDINENTSSIIEQLTLKLSSFCSTEVNHNLKAII